MAFLYGAGISPQGGHAGDRFCIGVGAHYYTSNVADTELGTGMPATKTWKGGHILSKDEYHLEVILLQHNSNVQNMGLRVSYFD